MSVSSAVWVLAADFSSEPHVIPQYGDAADALIGTMKTMATRAARARVALRNILSSPRSFPCPSQGRADHGEVWDRNDFVIRKLGAPGGYAWTDPWPTVR